MQYFSAETFRFLDDLTVHRDKAWFETNRDRYEGNLLGPLRSAVDDIGPALREHIPDCEIRAERQQDHHPDQSGHAVRQGPEPL